MSISPKSELTVLLWGDRWWLPGQKMPVPFGDLAEAADQLAAAWPEDVRNLRVVYQPDDFATVPVDCPNGNRATLALVLAEEHPALAHPGHVWAHEPILAHGERFNTLLHYETRPMLFALVHRLRELGFAVNAVFPMATWLNALPPELTETGALTVCALSPERFCLYRHSSDGVRAFRAGHGGDVLTAVARHLAGVPAQSNTEFVLYVTTDEKLVDQLAQRVPIDERHIVGVYSLGHALGRQTVIATRHSGQLLPPVPFVTPPQIVTLLSLALLFSTLTVGATPALAWWAGQRDQAEAEQECTRLRSELEPLRRNEKMLAEIRRQRAEWDATPLPIVELIGAIARGMPTCVMLTRLDIDRQGFECEGGVLLPLTEAQWTAWIDGLRRSRSWILSELPAGTPERTFTLKGRWP